MHENSETAVWSSGLRENSASGEAWCEMSDTVNKTFETGDVLDDKWVILEFIGKGGMGEVYRAHQLNLNRDVAIKVISREFVKSMEGDTEAMAISLERFRREVQVMAHIRHQNVLQIFDHGSASVRKSDEDIDIEYIVMEYVPGGTLRSTMSEEGFHPEEGRVQEWLEDYFLPLLEGVRALHDAGIIHRDLKPENVLLDGKIPKITDFGLARSKRLKPFTQSVDMRGTPPYMSPEHFLDLKRTDERTDVYALGKILYEAVTGKMKPDQIPFKQASLSMAETIFFQKLDRIIQEATADEKLKRTSSIAALRQALIGVLKDSENGHSPVKPVQATRGSRLSFFPLAGLLVILLGLSAGFGFFAIHERGHSSSDSGPIPTPLTLGKVFEGQATPPSAKDSPSPQAFHAEDGTTLRLIPGGRITLGEEASQEGRKTVEVAPFYMDENKVTNHQYVEFLNQVLSRIEVKDGVVKGDGQIWLLLGEVARGHNSVGYRDGRFYVIESSKASYPVLRVSPHGALAYTLFHGMRLPTEAEWLLALGELNKRQSKPTANRARTAGQFFDEQWCATPGSETPPAGPQPENPSVYSPVGLSEANEYGLRGLDAGGEWGVRGGIPTSEEKSQSPEFVAIGRFLNGEDTADKRPTAVKRFPWEAFEEVGFRCAVSAPDSTG